VRERIERWEIQRTKRATLHPLKEREREKGKNSGKELATEKRLPPNLFCPLSFQKNQNRAKENKMCFENKRWSLLSDSREKEGVEFGERRRGRGRKRERPLVELRRRPSSLFSLLFFLRDFFSFPPSIGHF
jgi:hypothetical protein